MKRRFILFEFFTRIIYSGRVRVYNTASREKKNTYRRVVIVCYYARAVYNTKPFVIPICFSCTVNISTKKCSNTCWTWFIIYRNPKRPPFTARWPTDRTRYDWVIFEEKQTKKKKNARFSLGKQTIIITRRLNFFVFFFSFTRLFSGVNWSAPIFMSTLVFR